MSQPLKAATLPDRQFLAVSGVDRIKLMQGLVTNDIRRLSRDTACYAGVLTGQGKLLYDCFVVDAGDDRILIDIAAAHAQDFLKRLTTFKLRAAVELAAPSFAVAAAWGEDAPARLGLDARVGAAGKGAIDNAHYAFIDPRVTSLGARLIYPLDLAIDEELAKLRFAPASATDYAAHRLALGIADSTEIGGEICYPLEANFELLHGVDFKKGCYIGQELTARMKLKGELRKRVLPLVGAAPLPGAGTPVTADGIELGPLIAASGTQGLALLRLDRLANAKEGAIRAQEVPVSIHWPDWLPQ